MNASEVHCKNHPQIKFQRWKTIHALINKIGRKAPSETLGKNTLVLHGDKLDEKIHLDKSSKYTAKGKLTKILGD